MKYLLLLFIFCGCNWAVAQNQSPIYSSSKSLVTFFSKAPLEDISAENTRSVSLINTATGDIVARVPIAKFEFPNKLMQSHFTENYMESDKYPVAIFQGKLAESIDFSKPGTYPISASGTFTVHGVAQKPVFTGTLIVSPGTLKLDSKFDVLLADHNIKVPKLVFNNIAERIQVSTSFTYSPRK